MGSPSGPPFDPDDPDRERRERDTEPIPRIGPDDGPGYGAGPGLSDGPSFRTTSATATAPATPARAAPAGPGSVTRRPATSRRRSPRTSWPGCGPTRPASAPRRVLPLEDEPSSLVARYLFPTERYRGEWKRHWIHLTNPLLIGVAATFVLGYLSGFLAGQDVGGADHRRRAALVRA